MGITGMQSGVARGRRRWIVNPVYAASEPGLGNNLYNRSFWPPTPILLTVSFCSRNPFLFGVTGSLRGGNIVHLGLPKQRTTCLFIWSSQFSCMHYEVATGFIWIIVVFPFRPPSSSGYPIQSIL